jgi:hypothetical protein
MKKPREAGTGKRCVNCNTDRYSTYRKGYCARCYRLIEQRRQAERWDSGLPSKLPSSIRGYSRRLLDRELPKFKRNRLKELDLRLVLLRDRELQRNSEVDGSQIEAALQRLAEWCRGEKNRFLDIAEKVNAKFDQEQRRLLLGWLYDIEESRRWDPGPYWDLIDREY